MVDLVRPKQKTTPESSGFSLWRPQSSGEMGWTPVYGDKLPGTNLTQQQQPSGGLLSPPPQSVASSNPQNQGVGILGVGQTADPAPSYQQISTDFTASPIYTGAGSQAYEVTGDETVAKQLENLLSKNSSYLQLARSGAMKTANSRGLLNSSIAAGAGEAAAIESALPIAQQDAGYYQELGQQKQQGIIDSYLKGQEAENQAGLYGVQSGYEQILSEQEADQAKELQEEKYGFESELQENKYGWEGKLQTQAEQAAAALQAQKSAAEAALQEGLIAAEMELQKLKDANALISQTQGEAAQSALQAQIDEAKINLQQIISDSEMALLEKEQQGELTLNDQENAAELAQIKAQVEGQIAIEEMGNEAAAIMQQADLDAQKYIEEMNLSQEAENAFLESVRIAEQQYMTEATKILTSPDFENEEARAEAYNTLTDSFLAGLDALTYISSGQGSNEPITSVEQAYQEILGRAADPDGLAYYQGQIDSGAMTIDDVVNELSSSQEAIGNGGPTTTQDHGIISQFFTKPQAEAEPIPSDALFNSTEKMGKDDFLSYAQNLSGDNINGIPKQEFIDAAKALDVSGTSKFGSSFDFSYNTFSEWVDLVSSKYNEKNNLSPVYDNMIAGP